MIAAAMHIAPGRPKTASIIATATRFCGACWISGNGSTAEYATLASNYKATTSAHPPTSARTRFFPGSRTSLPINVTLVHAVWAKSGPTIDLPKSNVRASAPVTAKPGCAVCGCHPLAQEAHHAELSMAELAFQPNDNPITTTAANAAVFAKVNVFWTILPTSSPRVVVHVKSAINAMATNCSVDRLIA